MSSIFNIFLLKLNISFAIGRKCKKRQEIISRIKSDLDELKRF